MGFMGHDGSMWPEEGFGYGGKRFLPEDFLLQGEVSPLHKRSRTFFSVDQQSHGINEPLIPPNPIPLLDESPMGLQLRKSPSLLDLIQMRLSQENTSSSCISKRGHLQSGNNKDDKFKASNFTASRLRIGSWEFITENASSGLTAKFYFAKQKLIWEVLDGGLKFKIEMEWSDITALKANFPKMK